MGKPRGTPYSQDLRDRVLDARGTVRYLADRFGVSPAYVAKAKIRLRETGERMARPFRGRPGRKLEPYFDALRARVAEVHADQAAGGDGLLAQIEGLLVQPDGLPLGHQAEHLGAGLVE